MEQLKLSDQKETIQDLNRLYVSTRKKYLVQFPEKYATFNKDTSSNIKTFNDSMLINHLNGKFTYGVFAGGYFNKFITFDVDYKDDQKARYMTQKIIYELTESYNIPRKDIHVSLSGSKGYHIDLFFKNAIRVTDLEKFFQVVMVDVGKIKGGEVEFRPKWTQGVKLPLGIHQRTGNRCWFVDNVTLQPIESYDYLNNVEPLETEIITDNDFDLTDQQVAEFEQVVESTDITINKADFSKGLQRATKIIEAGQLIESNTRNNVTLDLSKFFLSQGYEQDEAITFIMDILDNTPSDYFSEGSTRDHWLKETERIVNITFEREYTFGEYKSVHITKTEIIEVLRAGTFKTKQLLYAMLITSKRYGETFYLPESVALKMLGTKSKKTFGDSLRRLVEGGFIEYVRKGEIDKARSRQTGQTRHKPNRYRLTIEKPKNDEPQIKVDDNTTMIDAAYQLLTDTELKTYVKRYEYNNRWKRSSVS